MTGFTEFDRVDRSISSVSEPHECIGATDIVFTSVPRSAAIAVFIGLLPLRWRVASRGELIFEATTRQSVKRNARKSIGRWEYAGRR